MTEQRYVKNRTGEGQFFDRALGIHVRATEIVPVPEPVPAGSATAQRLAVGGLVYAGPEEVAAYFGTAYLPEPADSTEEEPATTEALAQARDRVIERRTGVLLEKTAKQLAKEAAALGLEVKPKANKQKVAAQIAVAEWQREHEK